MNQIIAIYPEDLQAVVQPGVTHTELNQKLSKYGLFFPPDPGAPATIGGMVANNAAGIQAIKYGVTKDYVFSPRSRARQRRNYQSGQPRHANFFGI
jgi:D-lactate dehydrogenase (cytochrome)